MTSTPDQNSAITPPPPANDLNRRTILAGAAWTIPAIAVATVAPAAAASTAPVLTFNQASYSGVACGTITGAYVTVTTGGVATAGVSVTTTLSGGYTFAGGATTNTQVSGSDGRVNLPSVSVPAVGGAVTATAISASSTASAGFNSSPSTSVWTARDSNASVTTFPHVPASASATAGNAYFVDGTSLWYRDAIVDTNVSKAVGGSVNSVNWVQYLKGTTWTARDSNGNVTTFPNVPASATATAGYGYFLDGTNLWYSSAIVDTNVSKAVGGSVNGVNWVQYLKGTTWTSRDSNGSVTTFPHVPASATATAGNAYFVDGTNLWYGDTIVDTNVTKVGGGSVPGVNWVQFLKSSTWTIRDSNGRNDSTILAGTPLAATPTNGLGYFISGTDLYRNGSILDTNVTKPIGGSVAGVDWVQYLKSTAC